MYDVSNHVLFLLNVLLFAISIPIMVISSSVTNNAKIDCVDAVQQPLLVVGILLCLVSLMGILGCCFRFPTFLWIYLSFLLLLMIGLFCFTMFLFVVTDDKAGLMLQDTGFMQDDSPSDNPSWLQTQIGKRNKWVKIRNCMRAGDLCMRAAKEIIVPLTPSIFGRDIALIQGGCCTPPLSCGFMPINATSWSSGVGGHPLEVDCKKWSNDPKVLCFECETCKVSIIQNLRDGWRRITAATFFTLVLLNVIFAVGCCAYKNLKLDKYPGRTSHH